MKLWPSMLSLLLALSTNALFAAVTKDLKVVDGKEYEERPGKELNEMIKANPKETLYVVKGVVVLNEGTTDYYKWFYDSKKRKLVVMQRSTMKAVGEHYQWRIWHDVSPKDFAEGLPYGNDKIKSTPSPYKGAVQAFPLKYPDEPEVTKWP